MRARTLNTYIYTEINESGMCLTTLGKKIMTFLLTCLTLGTQV